MQNQPLVPPPSSDAPPSKSEMKPAADRKAILNDLDDCTDCHNKAKRECNFKRCKLCCSRYTQMTGQMCDSHSSKESKARESLVGQVFTGIIDGLFENGFLITVDINNVVFKGLLFNSLCAVKVWKLPKTPAPIAGGNAHMKASGMTGIMDLTQPQPPLPTGTISSGTGSGQQFVPAPLAQFAQQIPGQMFAPSMSNSQGGKRKYVKSGLYSKKRSRDDKGGKDDDDEGSDDDDSASGANAVQPSFLTLMGGNSSGSKNLDWAASLPQVPSASSVKPKRKGPKRALTNYLVFVAEQRKKILPQYPNSTFKEIADIIGRKWKSMTEEEKRVYTEAADRDKERWKREKEEFLRQEAEAKQREKQLAAVTQAVLAQASTFNSVSMPQSLSAGGGLPFQISSSMFNVAGIPQGIPVGVQVSAPPVRAVSPAGTSNALDMNSLPAAKTSDSAPGGGGVDTDDDGDDDDAEMQEVEQLAAAAQEAAKTPKSGDKAGKSNSPTRRTRRK